MSKQNKGRKAALFKKVNKHRVETKDSKHFGALASAALTLSK